MRGKYASSADARRAREQAISAAAAAERRVRDLTTENSELRQDINGLLASHNAAMGQMRIALVKGETPALVARDEMLSELRAEVAAIRADWDRANAVHEKFIERTFRHFKVEHRMTNVDVIQEVLVKWCGADWGYFSDNPAFKALKQPGGLFDVEAAARIDIARGIRTKASVIRDAQQFTPVDEVQLS